MVTYFTRWLSRNSFNFLTGMIGLLRAKRVRSRWHGRQTPVHGKAVTTRIIAAQAGGTILRLPGQTMSAAIVGCVEQTAGKMVGYARSRSLGNA